MLGEVEVVVRSLLRNLLIGVVVRGMVLCFVGGASIECDGCAEIQCSKYASTTLQ